MIYAYTKYAIRDADVFLSRAKRHELFRTKKLIFIVSRTLAV